MPVAVIIPALNEAGSIAHVLQRLPASLNAQVIVVDNGSTDDTAAIARKAGALVIAEPRRGYGQACLTGLANLRADIDVIAFLDADGSDDPALLVPLLSPLQACEADFVVSARVLGNAGANMTPQQRFGNWLACLLIRLFWRYRYQDMGPLRAFTRDAYRRMALRDRTWGWNVEMQIRALECGLRIQQLDVPYGQRLAGQSKISGTLIGTVRAGWKILWIIAKLRLRPVRV